MQGAANEGKSSVQCAVLFQIIPLAFLLISALFLTQILVFFLIHFGVNLSFYFSVQGFRGGSPLTSGANCGLQLLRPRFAELAICVSPCGAILHLSLSAQMVSALPCVELERQRLYFSVSDRSAAVLMITILEKSRKVNESDFGYSSK